MIKRRSSSFSRENFSRISSGSCKREAFSPVTVQVRKAVEGTVLSIHMEGTKETSSFLYLESSTEQLGLYPFARLLYNALGTFRNTV